MEDGKITDELCEFPPEARDLIQLVGGIGHFLSQSLQFYHVDGFVCLMSDAPKAQTLARSSKKPSGSGQGNQNKKRALPPDTRSADQFPSLGLQPTDKSGYKANYQIDGTQNSNRRSSLRDNISQRETSTPESECTTMSDPFLATFFGAQLSQGLSQSSVDDAERVDAMSSKNSQDDRLSLAASDSGLFMPSAYGDTKSQESGVSDPLSSGLVLSNVLPEVSSSQTSAESRDRPLVVDTAGQMAIESPSPTLASPGLIHEIMGAKPLNQMSLDHPLFKAPLPGADAPSDSNFNPTSICPVELSDSRTSTDAEGQLEQEERLQQVNPLPAARAQSLAQQHPFDALQRHLTPERATITPPRPRAALPETVEALRFNIHEPVLPPHPDEEQSVTRSVDSPSLPPPVSRVTSAMPNWADVDTGASLGA